MLSASTFLPKAGWPSFSTQVFRTGWHTPCRLHLTTAFIVGGVSAWHLLKERTNLRARIMFSMAMSMATLVAPMQIVLGDLHGLNTLEHQLAKVMAMEGHHQSHPNGAPLILFGIPNSAENRIDYAIQTPKASSLLLKHDLNAPLAGLDTVPAENRPPAGIVFWSFRIMVGLGMLIATLGVLSLYARARGRLYDSRLLHHFALAMGPSGLMAVLAGWVATEVGRQPWTIYGLMRTTDPASPLAAPAVAASLVAFVLIYFSVFGAGIVYILKLTGKPPESHKSPLPNMPVRFAGTTPMAAAAREALAPG